jgi:hypothetical protein
MAGVLLALFPLLLLFNARLAWPALAAAIFLLVSKRLKGARRVARPDVEHDASI